MTVELVNLTKSQSPDGDFFDPEQPEEQASQPPRVVTVP